MTNGTHWSERYRAATQGRQTTAPAPDVSGSWAATFITRKRDRMATPDPVEEDRSVRSPRFRGFASRELLG